MSLPYIVQSYRVFAQHSMQELCGGENLAVLGHGVIINVSCDSGIFDILDGTEALGATPLWSVDGSRGFNQAVAITFTKGVYVRAKGVSSNIVITVQLYHTPLT